MQKDALSIARRLFESDRRRVAEQPVLETLLRFGRGALAYALRSRIRVILLRQGELYRQASPALARLGIDVDAWPAPPAGLFVVEERALYLRSRSPMTVAHEFGHALDCALGGGVYRSGIDPKVRALFAGAVRFVTPYAATGVDEYFAVMWNIKLKRPRSVIFRLLRERQAVPRGAQTLGVIPVDPSQARHDLPEQR